MLYTILFAFSNEWKSFNPTSNLLWLKYLPKKIIPRILAIPPKARKQLAEEWDEIMDKDQIVDVLEAFEDFIHIEEGEEESM